jgi:hypothetical protein
MGLLDGLTVHAIMDVGIRINKPFLADLKESFLAGLSD